MKFFIENIYNRERKDGKPMGPNGLKCLQKRWTKNLAVNKVKRWREAGNSAWLKNLTRTK